MSEPSRSISTDQMSRPCVIVSGLARCGSSLTMQMLRAGGVPCIGEPPAFEPPEVSPLKFTFEWMRSQSGKAFKLLDPQLIDGSFAGHRAIVILLHRDERQQAASMAKFGNLMMGLPVSPKTVRRLAGSFRRDLPRARMKFASLPTLALSFERLILEPAIAARSIGSLLRLHDFAFDEANAVNVVRVRSPDCYPGLLEASLIEECAL